MIVARPPSKVRPARPASRAVALVTAAAIAVSGAPARAQTGASAGIPMIRDAEIEQLLREYIQPILKVAGLSQQNVQIVIINDKSFNAFVMDAHRIFVNSGALMQATTPNQIIGVLAHETGHIVGGHLSKMRQELANAQTAAIVAMLLGIGALVAGARSGNMSTGNAGAAIVSAPQSYLMHTLLAYQRAQEEQADRAGVKFLTATGPMPASCWIISGPACPDCTRRAQASAEEWNTPRAGSMVRVESWPIWWQPMQPLFFSSLSHSACVNCGGMPLLPSNCEAGGIFSIEYQ